MLTTAHLREANLHAVLWGPDRNVLAALVSMTLLGPAVCLAVRRWRRWFLVGVTFAVSTAVMRLGLFFLRPTVAHAYARIAALMAIPLELRVSLWVALAAFLTARNIGRGERDVDVHDRIRTAVHRSIGEGHFSAIVAGELSCLYYGLFSWRARPIACTGQTLASYRAQAGYGVALPVILAVIAIETAVLDVLVSHLLDPRPAWALTVLGAYGMLWVVADDRAITMRPIVLDDIALRVRSGMRWSARVPLSNIAGVRFVTEAPARSGRAYKNLVLFGQPQILVDLKEPTKVEGLLRRTGSVQELGISVDDPGAFQVALQERGVPTHGEARIPSGDFYERLRDGLRRLLRISVGYAPAREVSILTCAFLFWRTRPQGPAPGGRSFTIHRKSGYGAIFGVFLGVSLIEMTVTRMLLRNVGAIVDHILLLVGALGVVWFFGDYHALRLRPMVVEDGVLHVRVGLRKWARVPLRDVQGLEGVATTGEPDRRTGYIRCTAMGPPQMLLRLSRPVEVEQMFRPSREVSCIGLTVDDEAAFRSALTSQRAVSSEAMGSGSSPAEGPKWSPT